MTAEPKYSEGTYRSSANSGSNVAGSTASYTKAARDVLIVAFLLLAFLKPDLVFDRISRLGITELNGPGFKASFVESHNTLLNAGAALSSMQQAVDGVIVQLKQLNDPKLSDIISELDAANVQATKGSHEVLATALQQQQQHQAILPSAGVEEGWIYLARTNKSGTSWKSHPAIEENYSPKDIVGQQVTLTRGVFLHNGPTSHNIEKDPPGWRANQPVIKVLHSGTKIRVANTEVNKALGGGESLWALIDVVD